MQTTVKSHSGGHAQFDEKFELNKPGLLLLCLIICHLLFGFASLTLSRSENMRVLRIGLEDSCLLGDTHLGK